MKRARARGVDAGDGVRLVLSDLTDTIDATWEATIDGRDIECLHEFRIAVRRSRTVLRECRALLPEAMVTDGRSLLTILGDLTGPPRDLDVIIDGWSALVTDLDRDRRTALEPLRHLLEQRRIAAHDRLSRALDADATRRASAAWRAHLAQPFPDADGRCLSELIEPRIRRAHRRLVEHAREVGTNSLPERVHEVRKDAKRLRYLIECFGDALAPRPRRRFEKQLRRLQEALGDFQDCEVQLHLMHSGAHDLYSSGASLDTLLAIGHLTAAIESRRATARRSFDRRFARFDRAEMRTTLHELFRARG